MRRTATLSLPRTDVRARALYDQGYSVRGLFAKLLEDEAHYPDTMNERVGGWGRLLALFRLVHRRPSLRLDQGAGAASCSTRTPFPFSKGAKPPTLPTRVS